MELVELQKYDHIIIITAIEFIKDLEFVTEIAFVTEIEFVTEKEFIMEAQCETRYVKLREQLLIFTQLRCRSEAQDGGGALDPRKGEGPERLDQITSDYIRSDYIRLRQIRLDGSTQSQKSLAKEPCDGQKRPTDMALALGPRKWRLLQSLPQVEPQ